MKIPAVMPDGTAMAAGIFLDKSIRGGKMEYAYSIPFSTVQKLRSGIPASCAKR